MPRAVLAALLLSALPAAAKEKWGVTLPDEVQAGGKTLKLNGLGLRVKFIVRVYVAGLYLEAPSKDPGAILKADQVRRVDLKMLRSLDKAKIVEAIVAGFEKNSKEQMPALKARLDQLTGSLTDLKEGQVLAITYVPGTGTTVEGGGKSVTLPGKDFGDALLAVWLGKDPVDSALKAGVLGG